jgi:hypothetical protein
MKENEITHLEGLEDHLVLTQASDFSQGIGGSSGQTAAKNELFAAKKGRLKSTPGKLEKLHGKCQPPFGAE